MTRDDKRKLVQKLQGMRSKASIEFSRQYGGLKEWSEGYAKGYIAAMNAVIQTVKDKEIK